MLTMVSNWNATEGRWDRPEVLGNFGCSPSLTEDGTHYYYGGRYPGGRGGLDVWTEKFQTAAKETPETYPSDGPDAASPWCSVGRVPQASTLTALVVARDGSLVVASEQGAVSRLDVASSSWVDVVAASAECLPQIHEGRPPASLLLLETSGVIVSASSAGITRSTDDGKTWSPATLPEDVSGARAIAQAPDGVLYGATRTGVVLRSRDEGASWERVGIVGLDVHAMAVDERGRLFLAGALMRVPGVPRESQFAVMRSDDEGKNFVPAKFDFHADLTIGYSVFPASERSLYASIWVHAEKTKTNIFRTTDGETLTHTSKIPGNWWDDRAMAFLEDDGSIYAGLATNESSDLVFRSADRGATWTSTGKLAPAREVYAMAKLRDGTLVAATSPFGEVYRLRSAGASGDCWPVRAMGADAGSVDATAPRNGGTSGCGCGALRIARHDSPPSMALFFLGALVARRRRR